MDVFDDVDDFDDIIDRGVDDFDDIINRGVDDFDDVTEKSMIQMMSRRSR